MYESDHTINIIMGWLSFISGFLLGALISVLNQKFNLISTCACTIFLFLIVHNILEAHKMGRRVLLLSGISLSVLLYILLSNFY